MGRGLKANVSQNYFSVYLKITSNLSDSMKVIQDNSTFDLSRIIYYRSNKKNSVICFDIFSPHTCDAINRKYFVKLKIFVHYSLRHKVLEQLNESHLSFLHEKTHCRQIKETQLKAYTKQKQNSRFFYLEKKKTLKSIFRISVFCYRQIVTARNTIIRNVFSHEL